MASTGSSKGGSVVVWRWQEIVKAALLIFMTVLIVVTENVSSDVANDAVQAALLALMAATTFLIGNLPTQGLTGTLLNMMVRLVAGTAAYLSALNWIASETDAGAHTAVTALRWATALVGFAVLVVFPFIAMKFSASTQERDE